MKKRINLFPCIMLAALLVVTAVGCGSSDAGGSSGSKTTSESADADTDTDESFLYYYEGDDTYNAQLFAMDTYMTVTAYGDNAQAGVEAAVAEIQRIDALLSTGEETSEVSQINAAGGGTLSEDTEYLLQRALEIYESTDGAYDITIYPIMEAWGFTTQDYAVPDDDTLAQLLALVDGSAVSYDETESSVSFGIEGMQIDFGGIAKGYTSSRIMEIFEENGVTSGLVSLGGNVQALNLKPDGSKWKIGIQNPNDSSDVMAALELEGCAVITSGGYERYFEEDGVTYHHIIDPETGYPADSGLISVTIVSDDGTLADGLSTSLFIMGLDEAVSYWRAHSDEFEAVLMTEDETLYVTEGLADAFSSDLTYEIVEAGE